MQLQEYRYFLKTASFFYAGQTMKKTAAALQPQQSEMSDQSRSVPLLAMTFLYQKKESFLLLEKSPLPSSCLLT